MADILLVEDDPLIGHNTSGALTRAGHAATVAMSVAEGLRKVSAQAFDLLLVDIGLPDGNGLDFARKIRRSDARVPIVFLTAFEDEAFVQGSIECGAHSYLVKPVSTRQILPVIETALADRKRRAESEAKLLSALDNGRETSTAVGLLMERFGWARDEAFEALRRTARSRSMKVDALARQIVSGEASVAE